MQAFYIEPHLVLKSKHMPLLRRVMKASVFILLVRLLGAAPLRLCVTVRLSVIRSACSRPCSRQVVDRSQRCCTKEINRGAALPQCLCSLGRSGLHAASPAAGRSLAALSAADQKSSEQLCLGGCALEGDLVCML